MNRRFIALLAIAAALLPGNISAQEVSYYSPTVPEGKNWETLLSPDFISSPPRVWLKMKPARRRGSDISLSSMRKLMMSMTSAEGNSRTSGEKDYM